MQTVLTQMVASTAHVGKALKEMGLIAQVCNWALPFIASVIMEPLLSTCITPSVASCALVRPRVYNSKSVQLPYGFYTGHLDGMK